MSTVVNFGGKEIVEPGFYALTQNGISQPEPVDSPGIVLLIDTGSGAGWGGGAGISGTTASGKRAVYSFTSVQEFRNFVRGGLHYDLAQFLFNPAGTTTPGCPQLMWAKAATTTQATITIELGPDTGTLVVKTKNEGVGANGVVTNGILSRGYAARVSAGIRDAQKFIVTFYQGAFSGSDEYGLPYDDKAEGAADALVVATSIEFTTSEQLAAWMAVDKRFLKSFTLDKAASTLVSVPVDPANLPGLVGNKLALGATEVYSQAALDAVLDVVADGPHTFFLADNYGTGAAGARSASNLKIAAHIDLTDGDTTFPKFLVVGGGQDEAERENAGGSFDMAEAYDTHRVILVHSGIDVPSTRPGGLVARNSLYHAAYVLGRTAGLPSYEPVTRKPMRILGVHDDMGLKARKRALQAGVLHTTLINNLGYCVNQGINTLQANTRLFNPDGHSHDMQPERIDSELINMLQSKGAVRFPGHSRAEANEGEAIAWCQTQLQSVTATEKAPGLIAKRESGDNPGPAYESVTATIADDVISLGFKYRINGPINKVLTIATKI